MRSKASWLLAIAGAAVAVSSAMADFSRDVTITAEYATTDNNGNPILGAGGSPQVSSVSRTFNIDNDFASLGVDADGTHWYEYTGSVRFGELPTATNNPSLT